MDEPQTEGPVNLLAADRSSAAVRSTRVSIVVNIGLTCVQVAMGILSHSQGLVADGIHSLSDLFADFVVLFASRHSGKAADEDHPYGHYRFENGASLVLGVMLLAVGVGMLWPAVLRLGNPSSVPAVHAIAIWVVALTLIAKELLFRYLLRIAQRLRSSMLVANAWHARSDAASSLVVGVGVLGNLAGYRLLDPVAALIVGLLIARMGWRFGWTALNDLMDRSADEGELAAIRATLAETPGVHGLHDLRTRKMGDMLIVDVDLEVDGAISVEAGHDIASAAQERVLQRHRVLKVMVHIDPWRRDADQAGAGRS